MRILLALLMSFVLLQTQCFALVGGPVFGAGQANLTGTYAGVLVEDLKDLVDPTASINNLGLFLLSVPTTGVSRGSVGIFASGKTFFGTIVGISDPGRGQMIGVIQANDADELGFDEAASGTLRVLFGGNLPGKGTGGSRITGTSTVTTTTNTVPTNSYDFIVDGFFQSNVTTPPGSFGST